jgi:hypothetical protein
MPYHDRLFAEVTDNADPDKKRRVKVRCPAIIREDADLPFWIPPLSLGRLFDVPAVGTRVELLIITGKNDEQQIARFDDKAFRWAPAFLDDTGIPQEIVDNYEKALAVWAADGSFMMIDKETGAVAIVMKDGSRLDVDKDGVITVTHKGGSKVTLDDSVIEIVHSGGDKIKLDGTNISIEGSSLLGGAAATHFLVRGDKLLTYMTNDKIWKDTHTHPTAAPGAPSVPTVPSPAIPTDLNSTTNKTE